MTIGPTSYSFARARSRLTFHTMMTRTRKPDVSETDVSSRKKPHRYLTKPDRIARSYKGGRYTMAAQCRTFRSGIAEGASLRKHVRPTSAVIYYIGLRMPHSNAASEGTFSMANNIGKVLSVILSQWLNVY